MALGIRSIALTDHDTTGGVRRAQEEAAGNNLDVIPGVEISTDHPSGECHILGYFIDPDNVALKTHLKSIRESRQARARHILALLEQLGVPITWEQLRAIAGPAAVARPHIARALLQAGHVRTEDQAFDVYLGRDRPAFVERYRLTPKQAIAAIHQAGGVAILAHPARSQAQSLVAHLASMGLDGLEVYYAGHTPQEMAALTDLSRRYNLVATGGSDFHGDDVRIRLGCAPVALEIVEALRARRKTRR